MKMMVRGSQATRWFRFIAAIALLICVLALLVPHSAGHGLFIAGVLFFPVFFRWGWELARPTAPRIVLKGSVTPPPNLKPS